MMGNNKHIAQCSVLAVIVTLLLVASLALAQTVRAGPTGSVNLGTAGSFGVLGATTVTNVPAVGTVIFGDLGVWPGTAITGFPPGIVLGAIHAGDAVAQQAQSDALTAYNVAAGLACQFDLTGQDLGGMTLTPGVYCFSSSAFLTGVLTLDGPGQYVFQIGSTLITATNSRVLLINGADPCDIFWQVGSSATIEVGTTFAGNVLALTSISIKTGATNLGGLYALNGAVTMDDNIVRVAPCNVLPTATSTNTAIPSTNTRTGTPTRTQTNTRTPRPTRTAVFTRTSTPTRTVTRSSTPILTFTRTRTSTPALTHTKTATRTFTRAPTRTPKPHDICKLYWDFVHVSCNPDGTTHWRAGIRNNHTSGTEHATWKIELQRRVGWAGQWVTIRQAVGMGDYPPDVTIEQGDFCQQTTSTDLVFYRVYASFTDGCPQDRLSPFIDACERPQGCQLDKGD